MLMHWKMETTGAWSDQGHVEKPEIGEAGFGEVRERGRRVHD